MTHMIRIFATAVLLSATPVLAEEEAGKSLMQQGAEMFLKGLTQQMEPALEDLQDMTQDFGPQLHEFFTQMGPALGGLLEDVEDWSLYELPEVLPNGDIIIRKKPEPKAPDNPAETPEGTTDL